MTGLVPPAFLSWLRLGLAAELDTPAVGGLAPADTAAIRVTVRAHGTGPDADTTRPVQGPAVRLTAPGEVIGLDPAQIVRHDPEPGTPDAEPDYLAQVELAAPDLPWRYTPAAAADGRLQPWLALVVVEDRAGVELTPAAGGRLPVLRVDDAGRELPDLTGCWAWAHVHADHDLAAGVETALAEAPEAFRSRLLCPRRLVPATSWIACIVPTFASGRQVGVGEPVTGSGLAWTLPSADQVSLPVYHSWRFATGPHGDFESLVERLTPRELVGGTGRRDLDVGDPGGGLPVVPGAVITYEGALVSPAGGPRPWPDAHRTAFKAGLRRLVNLRPRAPARSPEGYDALRDDPVVGPPAYASPQAGRRIVPADGADPVWFERLSTEPQHRVVAGLGTEVVRADAEALMAAAWRHAAGLRAVNRTLGRARLAWELGGKLEPRVKTLDDTQLLQLASPAAPRLPYPGAGTAAGAIASSGLPDGLLGGAFRRLTRAVRGFTRSGPAGQRLPLTGPVTAAAVTDPAGFTAAWRARILVPGIEVAGPLPDLGPLVSTTATVRTDGRAAPVNRPARPRRPGLDLASHVRDALDPRRTVTAMVSTRVAGLPADRDHDVPPRWRASPDFTSPMSERLIARSAEYLIPGVGEVPGDTLGLLEVNQAFVEAFLAGFNHELSREFLWREYPARLDGTWARRFWDTGPGGPPDITPIATWTAPSDLGQHRPGGATGPGLVLLLKGALPRRYPDLRVYAVEAEWTGAGTRREKPDGEVRLPVLTAELERDTHVWGFTLTERAARGSTDPGRDEPGWFFALEQRPGAVRFGLDAPDPRFRGTAPERPRGWAELSWSHLAPAGAGPLPAFARPDGPRWMLEAGSLPGNGGPGPQGEDAWGEDAAAMARITLQRPVRMLVHADSMLPGRRRRERGEPDGP